MHPLLFHPAYPRSLTCRSPERLAALAEPERRRRIIEEVPDDGGLFCQGRGARQARSHVARSTTANIDYEPVPPTTRRRRCRRDAACRRCSSILDQLTSHDGNGMLYAPFFNYAYGDLSMTYEATRHPHTRMGLSDAGAHCGAICDGGTPTFMLTHWARDRTRGPKLPLEYVVHRQTAQTAALYGLHDRGLVAPGMRADLNVIDFDALCRSARRGWHSTCRPAAAAWCSRRSGYAATFVAGVQTVADDEFTGALPGRSCVPGGDDRAVDPTYAVMAVGPWMKQNSLPSGSAITWKPPSSS